MKNPIEYATTPFLGMHVMQVDPGTVITDERTGQEATVEDDTFVTKGNVIFCTKKIFDRLKEEIQ